MAREVHKDVKKCGMKEKGVGNREELRAETLAVRNLTENNQNVCQQGLLEKESTVSQRTKEY